MYFRVLFFMSILLGGCSDGPSNLDGEQPQKDEQVPFDLQGISQCKDVERAGNADSCQATLPARGSCELSRLPPGTAFKERLLDCAKDELTPDAIKCVSDLWSSCPACVSGRDSSACTSCIKAGIDTCGKKIAFDPPHKSCFLAAAEGMGWFFDDAQDQVYNRCRQVMDEMRTAGCKKAGGASWVCKDACARTTSCLKQMENPGNATRCKLCYQNCKDDPFFCKKIADGRLK
jgi:hypothetical protein